MEHGFFRVSVFFLTVGLGWNMVPWTFEDDVKGRKRDERLGPAVCTRAIRFWRPSARGEQAADIGRRCMGAWTKGGLDAERMPGCCGAGSLPAGVGKLACRPWRSLTVEGPAGQMCGFLELNNKLFKTKSTRYSVGLFLLN